MKELKIAIVGAGASGMAAALAASENPNAQVLLLERQARVGRKLLATGNGRCNLSNLHAAAQSYHGGDASFPKPALAAFDSRQTLAWFRTLGLFTVAEESGGVYPYSDQANSVVDVLRFALDRPNIRVRTGVCVTALKKAENGFLLTAEGETIFADRVIVACGGMAGTKLGGSDSGYRLLAMLGHSCTPLRPALVQLKTDWRAAASLKGVRANCRIALCRDGRRLRESVGEIQFTDYGISGPVVFEISRDACVGGGVWACRMDFLPGVPEEALKRELQRRTQTALQTEELLTGILHNRLGRVLTKAAGVGAGAMVRDLRDAQLNAVCSCVKRFCVALKEPMGMDCAQVTAGGVRTDAFDPETMESRLVRGLYACGEVLDVDGDCGGYNLQWAWSSGRCAGIHAGGDGR